MTERRRGLGRGLGALIPSGPIDGVERPVDVFFPDQVNADQVNADQVNADQVAGEASAPVSRDEAGAFDAGSEGAGSGGTGSEGAGRAAEEPAAWANGEAGEAAADALVPVPGARFAEIPLAGIRPNPRQPRQVFDEDDLDELARSITEVGVLQPIVVRPADGEDDPAFELIMGERRWRAAERAGVATIPAIVRLTPDGSMLRDALLENLHRAQLNPLEEAAAYQQLLEDFACTHDELAARVARSRPQISNTIRLLKLPGTVQRRVAAGVLSAGHARALLGLPDGAAMERLAQRIVAEGLSVRATEEIVALGDGDRPATRRRPPREADDGALTGLETRLSDRLDTRVRITLGQRKGRIAIEFASVEDLERIMAVLSPELDADGPVAVAS